MSGDMTLESYLVSASREDMQCRVFGHSWNLDTGQVERPARNRIEWTVPCMRCTTRKTFILKHDGQIAKPGKYHYAKGYLIKGGIDKQGRGMIRLTILGALGV